MTRFSSAVRLEATLAGRQGFLYAAIFSGLIWLSVLLPMPRGLRTAVEPYMLMGDTCIIGFFFVAGTVFFEKQERTLGAIVSTPIRFREYLGAKLALLVAISVLIALVVPAISSGLGYRPASVVFAAVLGTLLMLLVGFTTSLPFDSISDWFLVATIPLAIMTVPPVLYYSGVWPSLLAYLVPMTGPLLLFGHALGQIDLTAWQILYALAYPVLCIVGLWWGARAMFIRYVVARSGGM